MDDFKLKALAEGLKQLDYRAGDGDVEAAADRVWERFESSMKGAGRPESTRQPKVGHRSWLGTPRIVGIAAVVLMALVMVIQTRSGSRTILPTAGNPQVAKTFSTRPGQRVSITLFDGTRVTLAPATKLSIMGRSVQLTGEAMFVVSHNSGSPFLVQTGQTAVRVLGTTFSVRQYPSERYARVAVAEGRISVGRSILNSGDLAVVEHNEAKVEHNAERVLNWLAFSQGTLALETQTLAEAAPELSRWLDLDVQVSQDVASRRLKAVLKNTSVSSVLTEIAELTETSYSRNGRKVVFTSLEK